MLSENKVVICDRCKEPITDIVYVRVSGAMVKQKFFNEGIPMFKSREHQENYAQVMDMHDECWIKTLKDHNMPLHNMTEVLARMAKEHEEKQQPVSEPNNDKPLDSDTDNKPEGG